MSHAKQSAESTRGMFTGFEEYLPPTDDDYRSVLTTGLVVLDTNVLLNLYRYNVRTQEELVGLLGRLGERIWVPHQVLAEFWRNRESVAEDSDRGAEATVDELEGHRERATETFRRWARRFALPEKESERLIAAIRDGFAGMMQGIQKLAEADTVSVLGDAGVDPVLEKLAPVLEGRVGAPMETEAYESALKEGMRRVQEQEPPGYLDKSKSRRSGKEGAAGDYLVWEQVLRQAEQRKCDVLFVTGDVKEDWWRLEGGQQRGPRPELADEMRSRAGVRLFMLRPESLLVHAGRVLEFEVSEESLTEVKRVDELASRDRKAGSDSGWTREALQLLLERLATEGPVQAAVIRLAAQMQGFVDRDKVYELGEYEESRTLRGFTRPVKRITQQMRDSGEIPLHAIEVLAPVYDPTILSFNQAAGFSVPEEIIPLLRPQKPLDQGS